MNGLKNIFVFSATHRTINCMVGQMKHILATEQKKTDFRPEDENNVMIQYTTVRDARPQLLPLSSHAKQNKSANATCKSLTSVCLVVFRINSCQLFCQYVFHVSLCVSPPGRPAPRYVPTSVGRWSTCGSPWMGKMWTRCWRSWAFVSTGSSTSTYSSTATAQWEACWPSATWLNTDGAPRTSGWAGGHRSRIHWSQGKTWLLQQRLYLCLLLHKLVRSIQVKSLANFTHSVHTKGAGTIIFIID